MVSIIPSMREFLSCGKHTDHPDADKFIDSQLMLLSNDRLAQHWVGFGHISYFQRVDIDSLLAP